MSRVAPGICAAKTAGLVLAAAAWRGALARSAPTGAMARRRRAFICAPSSPGSRASAERRVAGARPKRDERNLESARKARCARVGDVRRGFSTLILLWNFSSQNAIQIFYFFVSCDIKDLSMKKFGFHMLRPSLAKNPENQYLWDRPARQASCEFCRGRAQGCGFRKPTPRCVRRAARCRLTRPPARIAPNRTNSDRPARESTLAQHKINLFSDRFGCEKNG